MTRLGSSARAARNPRQQTGAFVFAQPVDANERYFHEDMIQLSTPDLLVEYGALLLSSLTVGMLELWCEERLERIRKELLARNTVNAHVLERPALLLLKGLRRPKRRSRR
jgi:hypothetical protein